MAEKKINFGTGGIRGIRGPGLNQFNTGLVQKVAFGHAKYLREKFKNLQIESKKFVIAFDARHQSSEFAHVYAREFSLQGFEVFLCREPRPTPFLSYCIKKYECVGGACITASHNPGEYSGIKVYGSSGGQVVSPEDKELVAVVESFDPAKVVENQSAKQKAENSIHYIEPGADQGYMDAIASSFPLGPQVPEFDVAFTALHGCGGALFEKLYHAMFGKKPLVVKEQFLPDGDFPTVVQPNPEVPSTMKLVEELGKAKNCVLVLATDGDGDRIGFGEWDPETKSYWYPTGNEILVLLTDFVLSKRKQKTSDGYCVKTIVSTELLEAVAKQHDVRCISTLTGFKWIVDYAVRNPEQKFVCGGEESFGFLFGDSVADKDGMASLALIVQLKMDCEKLGVSIKEKMTLLYKEHGYFLDHVDSKVFKTPDALAQVTQGLELLRKKPPVSINGYQVEKIWDLQNDQHGACELTATEGGFAFAGELNMPVSNVLQFYLANGSKISVRPSGTEPKMKVYYSLPDAIVGGDKAALKEKFAEIQSHVWSLLGDSPDDSQGSDR